MSIWAIVPAAGVGHRMGSAIPKQYLPLCGKPVIAHTLERIAQIEDLPGLLLVLHPDDQQFAEFFYAEAGAVETLEIVRGGDERCHSVLNAVLSLKTRAQPDDWVLVHDAARPCVRAPGATLPEAIPAARPCFRIVCIMHFLGAQGIINSLLALVCSKNKTPLCIWCVSLGNNCQRTCMLS